MSINHIPSAILFDWDGTLADSHERILGCHNHVREVMGLDPWGMEDLFERRGAVLSTNDLYPQIYGEKTDEAIRLLDHYVQNLSLDSYSLMPGAEELISQLSQSSIPMGVVSNKRHHALVREIEHIGWTNKFHSIVGAGRAAADKPYPEPLIFAAEEINPKLCETDILYVGDTETDLKAAQLYNCSRVYISWGKDREDLIRNYAPVIQVQDLYELSNLFEEMIKSDGKKKAC